MNGLPPTTNFRPVSSSVYEKSSNGSAKKQNFTQKLQDRPENEVSFLVNDVREKDEQM